MLRSVLFRDFKGADTVLVWGDQRDRRSLYEGLHAVLESQSPTFRIEGGAGLSELLLQAADQLGVSKISGTEDRILWRCAPDILRNVIAAVEALASVDRGHQFVDSNGGLASQVLISINEYPDTFRR